MKAIICLNAIWSVYIGSVVSECVKEKGLPLL